MVIFLPLKLRQTGGSSTFARKLKKGLEPKGHKVCFKYQKDYDVLLVNAMCPLRYLIGAKLRRKPILQRLDGVYYPGTVAGKWYWFYNLPVQIVYHFFADFVIFQSRYSMKSCNKYLGYNRTLASALIYNGVDTHKFHHQGQSVKLRDNVEQKLFITTSRFRRMDQIEPLVEAFIVYREKYEANSKLVIIGNFEGDVADFPKRYGSDSGVVFPGAVNNSDLPPYLRAADVFLFTHMNPPCPNNVLEAMACGLPICGVNDGAMSEIVISGVSGELVDLNRSKNKRREIDYYEFARNMQKILNNLKEYQRQARIRAAEDFNLKRMTYEYLETLMHLTDKR